MRGSNLFSGSEFLAPRPDANSQEGGPGRRLKEMRSIVGDAVKRLESAASKQWDTGTGADVCASQGFGPRFGLNSGGCYSTPWYASAILALCAHLSVQLAQCYAPQCFLCRACLSAGALLWP